MLFLHSSCSQSSGEECTTVSVVIEGAQGQMLHVGTHFIQNGVEVARSGDGLN